MSYKHLTIEQRISIETLVKEGYSTRQIASRIGVHHSTIARELKRCHDSYQAFQAQTHASENKSKRGRRSLSTKINIDIIEDKLKLTWSPEQIVGRGLQDLSVKSFKTIYNWLHNGTLTVSKDVLRRKGKAPRTQERRGKFTIGTTIHDRPKQVDTREEFGHWEVDTVVSSRGQSKHCLLTLTERKTRFNIVVPIENRKSETVLTAIQSVVKEYGIQCFNSITSDRGKEFSCFTEIESMGIKFYFADAYAAWQRGTNENANGLLREFFPKKTNFDTILPEEILCATNLINNRPRKTLDFLTAREAFMHEIIQFE